MTTEGNGKETAAGTAKEIGLKKNTHSLFLFLLWEEFIRLKRELVSWRGLVVLAVMFYIAVDFLDTDYEKKLGFVSAGLSGYWLLMLFPVRLGRMFYLLPFRKREQKSYIVQKIAVSLLYLMGFMCVYGGILFLFREEAGAYRYWLLPSVVLSALPLWITASAILLLSRSRGARTNYGFFTTRVLSPEADEFDQLSAGWTEEYDLNGVKESCQKDGTKKQKKENRAEVLLYVYMMAVMMITMLNGMFGLFGGNLVLFGISSAVSYAMAISSIWFAFHVIFREIDGDSRPRKGGGGCSL